MVKNTDGTEKQNCEINAAKRLIGRLRSEHRQMEMLLSGDDLYSRAPFIEECLVRELGQRTPDGVQHYYVWTNELCLCESATQIKVNFLLYEQTTPEGVVTRRSWITNLPLQARTVERVMRDGRSRWKIENETFNTLKHQGYHFEHNYGHGQQQLATVLALLMMLAFVVDQIQQRCCRVFRQLWQGLGTKAKLWEMLRSVFRVLAFPTMERLFHHIAFLYRLQLE